MGLSQTSSSQFSLQDIVNSVCSGAQSQGRYLAHYGNTFPELHLFYSLVSITMSNVNTVSVSVLSYTVKEYCDNIHYSSVSLSASLTASKKSQ